MSRLLFCLLFSLFALALLVVPAVAQEQEGDDPLTDDPTPSEQWADKLLALDPLPDDASIDVDEPEAATAMALRVLAARVRSYAGGDAASPSVYVIDTALQWLATEDIAESLTDRQACLAVAAGIQMLHDDMRVFDATARDGALIQVKHRASAVLDAVVESTPGRLYNTGGMRPLYAQLLPGYMNPRITEAWETWWPDAAGQPRSEWHIDTLPTPTPEELQEWSEGSDRHAPDQDEADPDDEEESDSD